MWSARLPKIQYGGKLGVPEHIAQGFFGKCLGSPLVVRFWFEIDHQSHQWLSTASAVWRR